jgi:hypothetical protein
LNTVLFKTKVRSGQKSEANSRNGRSNWHKALRGSRDSGSAKAVRRLRRRCKRLRAHTAAMSQLKTQIDIDAPAAIVWSILSDFAAYGRWNPLIRDVLGRAGEGRRIEITATGGDGRSQNTQPLIARLRENREMQWVDGWRLPGLFTAERRFRIELRSRGVRFHFTTARRAAGYLRC